MFLFLLDVGLGANHDASASGLVSLFDTAVSADDAAGGKIGRRDILHQFGDGDVGIIHHGDAGIDTLGEIVGRHVGGHTHGDAGSTVDQEVGDTCGEHGRLAVGVVVVGLEVDRVGVDVAEHLFADFLQTHLGVSHGGRSVAVDRAEIALTFDETLSHGPGLSHADDSTINR